jgi:hypothetical protein
LTKGEYSIGSSTPALLLDDSGIMFDCLLGWLLKWSCSNQNAMLVPLSKPLFSLLSNCHKQCSGLKSSKVRCVLEAPRMDPQSWPAEPEDYKRKTHRTCVHRSEQQVGLESHKTAIKLHRSAQQNKAQECCTMLLKSR